MPLSFLVSYILIIWSAWYTSICIGFKQKLCSGIQLCLVFHIYLLNDPGCGSEHTHIFKVLWFSFPTFFFFLQALYIFTYFCVILDQIWFYFYPHFYDLWQLFSSKCLVSTLAFNAVVLSPVSYFSVWIQGIRPLHISFSKVQQINWKFPHSMTDILLKLIFNYILQCCHFCNDFFFLEQVYFEPSGRSKQHRKIVAFFRSSHR